MKISSAKEVEKFRCLSAKNRKQGDDYETYLSRRLRLTKQRGSGCGLAEKEDHVGKNRKGEDIMVQAKSFSGIRISFTISDLANLVKHAAECSIFEGQRYVGKGRKPVFVIGIKQPTFTGPKDWVLIPLEEWEK